MMHFVPLQKLARVSLKKSFSLVYKTMRVIRINSSIEVVYIWTFAVILSGRDSRRFLQMTGKIIANAQTISHIFES